jgi:hypothetical protein
LTEFADTLGLKNSPLSQFIIYIYYIFIIGQGKYFQALNTYSATFIGAKKNTMFFPNWYSLYTSFSASQFFSPLPVPIIWAQVVAKRFWQNPR